LILFLNSLAFFLFKLVSTSVEKHKMILASVCTFFFFDQLSSVILYEQEKCAVPTNGHSWIGYWFFSLFSSRETYCFFSGLVWLMHVMHGLVKLTCTHVVQSQYY